MKQILACILLLIFFIACKEEGTKTAGRVYFFSNYGNDSSAGTIEAPWKSLSKLQGVNLQPGDTVYFSAGDTLDGSIVIDSADFGSAAQPVVITTYGNTHAVIRSGELSGLAASQTKHLVVSNLSFIGAGRKTGSTSNGVGISLSTDIKLDDLEISGYQKSGLLLYSCKRVDVNNVTAIENGSAGIAAGGDKDKLQSRDITIRNCKAINNPGDPTNFDNHSGNGIIVGQCTNVLIEYCMATNNGWDMPRIGNGPVGIWAYEADSVTIQYCISFRNKTAKGADDGGGFDFDGGVTNSLIQYCLSYENEGAGFGIFQYAGASNWYNNTIRYNISENDGNVSTSQGSIYIWNGSRDTNQMKDLYFYNNIIYNTKGAPIAYALQNEQRDLHFYNNVFVSKDSFIRGRELNGIFSHNNWYSLSGKQKFVKDSAGLSFNPAYKNPANSTIVSPQLLEGYTNYDLPQASPLFTQGLDLAASKKMETGKWGFGKKRAPQHGIGAYFNQQQPEVTAFRPGAVWKDTDGNFINAHGGGMLFHEGTYYWFGEIKKGITWRVPYITSWEAYRVNAGGVSCYSSKDLLNWKYEGVALAPNTTDSAHDLHTSKVIERPKVIYNAITKKFVMWMHIDSEDYAYARAGVAVSDNPAGPFKYIRSVRPNGNMSRDMTIFKDDNGKAYHFFSSEGNATMHIALLADDYLSHTTTEKRILIDASREAPAVFKHEGKYYLVSSGCTGWSPNPASWAIADSIMGEWKHNDNPCIGNNTGTTFQSQSTFVVPVQGKKDQFLFMADRWNKTNLEDSRYIWLALIMKNGRPEIEWKEEWKF